MINTKKYIIQIGVIKLMLFLYIGCVSLEADEEYIKTSKISKKKGNWEQITDYKLPEEGFLLFNFETGKMLDSHSDFYSDRWDVYISSQSILINNYYNYGENYKDIFGKTLGVLLPKEFEDVAEAPDPKDKIYNRHMDALGGLRESSIKGFEYDIVKGTKCYSWGMQSHQGHDHSNIQIGVTAEHKHTDKDTKRTYTLLKVLPKRTLVVRTDKGLYVKLQLQNIYKDAPELPTPKSEIGYISFRYFIQKDGSRSLLTK